MCVDPGFVRRMHYLGKIDDIAKKDFATDLTASDIKDWIQCLVDLPETTFDPIVFETAIATLRVPIKIKDPEARYLEYINDFVERLETVGY